MRAVARCEVVVVFPVSRYTFEELQGFVERAKACIPGTAEAVEAAAQHRAHQVPPLDASTSWCQEPDAHCRPPVIQTLSLGVRGSFRHCFREESGIRAAGGFFLGRFCEVWVASNIGVIGMSKSGSSCKRFVWSRSRLTKGFKG